jgi:hypothetical protein
MKRTLPLVSMILLLASTGASAENWVSTGTLQYDADSAYVGTTSGLVYFTACMSAKCVAGDTDQLILYVRYDCDTRMESSYDSFGGRWTDPVAHTGELETKLCAQRASLPRHQ